MCLPCLTNIKQGTTVKPTALCLRSLLATATWATSALLTFLRALNLCRALPKAAALTSLIWKGPDNTPRMDLLYGFRFGWTLPLYRRDPGVYYYN